MDPAVHDAILTQIHEERLGAVLTALSGPNIGQKAVLDYDDGVKAGTLVVASSVLHDAQELMARERNATLIYDQDEVFVEILAPPPHLLIFGAVHTAQALTALASLLGYRVVVSDARAAFTTEERFPQAAEILVGWPDELADRLTIDRRTYVVLLSHDARFEDPVLPMVLASPAKYVGAMGSRRTHAKRIARLEEAGYSPEQIARIHGPIGLDIGAETPEETAVSILAEMIQVRYGVGTGASLIGREGRIHLQRTGDEGDV